MAAALDRRIPSTDIEGDPALEDRFGPLLDLAHRVRHQEQSKRSQGLLVARPRGGVQRQGKVRVPYEFGCKVSIATPAPAPKRRAVRAACQGPARQSL